MKVNVDVLDVDDVEDMSALCRAIVVVQEMMRVCASCVVQRKLDWVGLIVTNMLSRNAGVASDVLTSIHSRNGCEPKLDVLKTR